MVMVADFIPLSQAVFAARGSASGGGRDGVASRDRVPAALRKNVGIPADKLARRDSLGILGNAGARSRRGRRD